MNHLKSLWFVVIHVLQLLGHAASVLEEKIPLGRAHLFSSIDGLQKLFATELEFKRKLETYHQTILVQLAGIDNFLKSQYSDFNHSAQNSKDYVSNPINTFHMIKRISLNWPAVYSSLINETHKNEWTEDIQDRLKQFPGHPDVEGAANGLFLLQETYNLNITKFANGELEVPDSDEIITSPLKLHSHDLAVLGKLAFNRGYYDNSIEWEEVALTKALEENDLEMIKDIQYTIRVMKQKHDQILERKGPRGKDWRTYVIPFDEVLLRKKRYKKAKLLNSKRYQVTFKLNKSLEDHDQWDMFNALCRGEKLRSDEEMKDITCRFLHHNNPYLKLGPFKIEDVNIAPYIGIIRDFMHDKDAKIFMAENEGKLFRSTHGGKNGRNYVASVQRTSSQNWFYEHHEINNPEGDKTAAKVSNKIRLATGLEAYHMEGEPFQVANYGVGGVYGAHTDSKGEFGLSELQASEISDRLATSMVYLTDVAAGGATVFPRIGVTLWPKKGDMAFWFNNDWNGRLDGLTYHGGCPVLAGSKWITNKWIWSRPNWKKYKCSSKALTNELLRIPPLQNSFQI